MYSSYKNIIENGAYKFIDDLDILIVTGEDAANYINTQTTNETINIGINNGIANNLVDRKAKFKAHFTFHRLEDKYIILCENAQIENLKEHLENFHFTEDFEMNDVSDQKEVLMIRGESSSEIFEEFLNVDLSKFENYDILETTYQNNKVLVIANQEFGDNSLLLIYDKSQSDDIKNNLLAIIEKYEVLELDNQTSEILRVEEGIPKYNIDFNAENILPETGYEKFSVSYSKGCYLGQEVIARIKTYGTVPKALTGFVFEGEPAAYGSKMMVNNKNIGMVKSVVFSPFFEKYIALVYLNKDYRKPEEIITFTVDEKEYSGTVKLLPFYKTLTREEKAKAYYEKSLTLFAENKEEESVKLLKKAIKNKPDFADAYEALGVILSRLEKYHEAIEIMNKLTEVSPDEPMARTNLSIFYMKIGNKDEAEAQMAKATTIKFMNAMKENKNKKALEAKKKEEIEMIRERMEMFVEVLETEDPEDLIANYGMGKSHYDLEEFSQAIPYFQKAVEIQKDYSMAFLYLGKSLEKEQKISEALEVYKKGIIAASQKGDLMPLREMEQRKLVLS